MININSNYNKEKIIKYFNEKKFLKISKISKQIIKIYKEDPNIWKILILSELNLNNLNKAENYIKNLISFNESAENFYLQGNILKLQNKFEESIVAYEKAISLKKNFPEAYNNLANSQKNLNLIESAILSYKKSINFKQNLEAHFNLANLYYNEKKFNEALENYKEVLKINKNFVKAITAIGQIYSILGNFNLAKEYFLDSINKDPLYTETYVYYVTTRKIFKDDEILNNIKIVLNENALSNQQKQNLYYALSKIFFDINDSENAFKYLEKAKLVYLNITGYSIKKDKKYFDQVKNFFSKEINIKLNNKNNFNSFPIFILGMPRSGTSLIEQILSSHSSVYGGGELSLLPKILEYENCYSEKNLEKLFNNIRKNYLDHIKKLSNKKYVTDKMPFNFISIGFILNSIPEAKIIHMIRNPMATCWSNYKSNFFGNLGMGYAHNQENVIEFYLMYKELMKFWELKFPKKILNINYDHFVLNPKLSIKKLVYDLGLEWEEKIMNFNLIDRPVETNSLLQVRNQIFKNSSDDWKKYKKYLEPMTRGLSKNNIAF